MTTTNLKNIARLLAVTTVIMAVTFAGSSFAQAAGVDPAATKILKRMSNHLGGLKKFSVTTHNDIEDLLDSGQRVDHDVLASVTVSRPNKLHAARKGNPMDQAFFYNGKELSLYNRSKNVYSTVKAPGTIEKMLGFAQGSLGLILPAADLIYRDTYPLLMEGVSSAKVIGKVDIGGVSCDHLAFSRPGVDFQVWVADSGPPLPYKYVVTDTGSPQLLSVSVVMSDWSVKPSMAKADFNFVPPKGVKAIPFMLLDANGVYTHKFSH